jgi:peptide/nickel transport system substrate-binding protein
MASFKSRTLVVIVLLVAVLLTVASCGSGSSSSTSSSPASAGAAKSGGALKFAWEVEPTTLDPIAPSDNAAIYTILNVFEQLVRVNADGSDIEAGLATSWDISADGLTYTFHLRDGAKFSDGAPVTADDVVFSLDRVRGETSNWSSQFVAIESVAASDPSTVVVTLKEPSAVFLARLALFSASITPKQAVTSEGKAFGDKPIGSGPFMVSSWQRGVKIDLAKNPNYWEAGKPYLDSATFLLAPEANSRALQLQSGEVDIARPIAFSALKQLEGNPALVVQTNPQLRSDLILMNNTKPPFDDPLVRQAMNYAIDREAIVKAVFFGHATTSNTYLPQMPGWWDESVPQYPYDVTKAKELLTQAGLPDGFSTEMLLVSSDPSGQPVGLIIKQNLAAVGVDVKLVSLESAAEWSTLQKGDFEMSKEWGSSDILDPDQMTTFMVVLHERAKSFWTRYYNPFVEKTAFAAQTEMDSAKRHEMYNQIQAQVTKDAPFVFMYYLPDTSAFQSYVKGYSVLPTGNFRLQDVWLDK